MNRSLLLCAIAILAALPAFAKKAPGYYVTLDYDTVQAQFSITQFNKRSVPLIDLATNGGVLYFDEDEKLQILSPENVLEVVAIYNGHTMRKLARLHPNKSLFNSMTQYHNGYIFLDVHQDGLVKLLSYIEHHPKVSLRYTMLQYDNEPLTRIDWTYFKEEMAAFFKDYAALVEKIEQEVYTKKHLEQIVHEYNLYHTKNSRLRSREPATDGF